MGSSESKNDDTKQLDIQFINEKNIDGSNPYFSFSSILKPNNATCKIEANNSSGVGFFATFPVIKNSLRICGLITNNHILSMVDLLQGKKITLIFDANNKKKEIKLDEKRFRFTCPLIDITFIEFSPDELDSKIGFLEVNETLSKVNESAHITQHSFSGECTDAQGIIKEIWGFELYHTISTDLGSSGAPLVNDDGIVIGVHKSSLIKENYSKAIDIYYLNAALSNFVNNNIKSFSLTIGNPKKLTLAEIEELKKNGLQSTTSPYVFISPSSKNVTPLWFYRTNFAWFWTPKEPKSYSLSDIEECNWSFIDPNFEIKAIGGKYDQVSPAPRNIKLISWLAGTGLRFIV